MVEIPAGAVSLGQFVREEAGAELAAVKSAYERLAAAGAMTTAVIEAGDAFAAAVATFHAVARKRLLSGEIIAFGKRESAPWMPAFQMDAEWWDSLVWGADDPGGWAGGLLRYKEWRPKPADHWRVTFTEAFERLELPGGADVTAEIAHDWMASVRLDFVDHGRLEGGQGHRVIGIAYHPERAPVQCWAIPATAVSPEAACRAWLAALVAAGDPQEKKPRYWATASATFGVSKRAFESVWSEVTREHPAWTAPGRRRNK